MEKNFDRAAEDLGNIIGLEHVNVLVPDQRLATLFYISGLGLTRLCVEGEMRLSHVMRGEWVEVVASMSQPRS